MFNNPLSFTDPSGYFIKWIGRTVKKIVRGVGKAFKKVLETPIVQSVLTIAAGVYCGPQCAAAASAAFTAINGGSLSDVLFAAAVTYVSAEAFGVAGDASGAEFLSAEHLKTTLAHGVVGGVTAEVSGGHFRDGFLAAGAAQFAAPGVGRIATRTGRAMAAAAVGGTASKLGGGKFANGAVTAAFARLYGEAYREAQRTRFKTQHDAARTILDEVNPRSIKENREYGGSVYENPDGTYSVTQSIQGTIDSVDPGAATLVGVPSKSTMTAYYHTHGANTPGYFNELFSGIPGVTGNYGDIPYTNHFGIDGYLATPSGAFQHYDHRTGAIATLGRVSVR